MHTFAIGYIGVYVYMHIIYHIWKKLYTQHPNWTDTKGMMNFRRATETCVSPVSCPPSALWEPMRNFHLALWDLEEDNLFSGHVRMHFTGLTERCMVSQHRGRHQAASRTRSISSPNAIEATSDFYLILGGNEEPGIQFVESKDLHFLLDPKNPGYSKDLSIYISLLAEVFSATPTLRRAQRCKAGLREKVVWGQNFTSSWNRFENKCA